VSIALKKRKLKQYTTENISPVVITMALPDKLLSINRLMAIFFRTRGALIDRTNGSMWGGISTLSNFYKSNEFLTYHTFFIKSIDSGSD
jgi:hypothetical protein